MKRSKVVRRVEQAVDEHTQPEHGRPYAQHEGPPSTDELRHEQREELEHTVAGPGIPAMTRGMWHGLVAGSLIGGLIGAILLLPLGFIPMGDLPLGWRLLLAAAAGALAGGMAGALYLGGRMPELEGETVNTDGSPGVGSSPRDPSTDDRGRSE